MISIFDGKRFFLVQRSRRVKLDYTCRARWPRRGFCAGEPQKSCPSVRSSVTTPHHVSSKIYGNSTKSRSLLKRYPFLTTVLLPSKQYCIFGVPKCVISEMCPLLDPFLITFLLPSKQYCTFQGPNMAQHKLSKIAQNSVTATTNDERTDRRTSDF